MPSRRGSAISGQLRVQRQQHIGRHTILAGAGGKARHSASHMDLDKTVPPILARATHALSPGRPRQPRKSCRAMSVLCSVDFRVTASGPGSNT